MKVNSNFNDAMDTGAWEPQITLEVLEEQLFLSRVLEPTTSFINVFRSKH